MNSTVGPSFKVVFVEKIICESHEQCTRSTYQNVDAQFISFQQHLNGYIVILNYNEFKLLTFTKKKKNRRASMYARERVQRLVCIYINHADL